MSCKVMISVISERVVGDIGDDWAYVIDASAWNAGVEQSAGTITVDEHRIVPGAAAKAPTRAQGVTLEAGDCGTAARVVIKVAATEVDWLVDDAGSDEVTIPVECPGPGGPRTTLTHDMAFEVEEAPGFLGGNAEFQLKLSIVAWCD